MRIAGTFKAGETFHVSADDSLSELPLLVDPTNPKSAKEEIWE
jgi:hypothetical protein